MTPDGGLRSRLIYIRPDPEDYDAVIKEANTDRRSIPDEAVILIREAIAARKRRAKK